MNHINIEIKARCSSIDKIRETLIASGADFKGVDRQIDTYFRSNDGRLKLREGNIETALIHYHRENKSSAKLSKVKLYKTKDSNSLKELLNEALGIKIVVEKKREIYFIGNVKFHLDAIEGLGEFVEIEVIGNQNSNKSDLEAQCKHYMEIFGINGDDLLPSSYSDMLSEIRY